MDSCIGSNSQFSDPDTEELLSFFKDPDPFLCDVAHVMDSCIRSQSQLLDEQTVPSLPDTQRVSEDVVSSSSSCPSIIAGLGGKKTASRRYKKKSSNHRLHKSYVCDWCDRKAAFKSGQGLRFHKTLRCPRREAHLGETFVCQVHAFLFESLSCRSELFQVLHV